ncbi:MAG: SRPBCC family protein [Pseudohongiellaceae bacterium]
MTDQQLHMFPGAGAAAGETAKNSSFSLSRTLSAAPQKVIDQWLIPVFIGEWMLGRHVGDDEVLTLQNTVRRGGEFSFETRRAGKKVSYEGSYQELRIPQRLAFNWRVSSDRGKETLVTVDFSEQKDRTRLKLQVKIPPELAARTDEFKAQWTSRLDALASRLKGR